VRRSAGGDIGTRTADGSQSPEANPGARDFAATVSALMFLFCLSGAASQPDENQSGRDGWTNRQVGPARSEMIRHPYAGANLRRVDQEPQERRRVVRGKDQRLGQAAMNRRR